MTESRRADSYHQKNNYYPFPFTNHYIQTMEEFPTHSFAFETMTLIMALHSLNS